MIESLKNAASNALKKMLGQELVKQYTNPDPMNKYACFFTAFFMYFRTVHGMKFSFAKYKQECLVIGAMKENFTILDHSKMAAAAGYPKLKCKNTSSKITEKIFELLLKNCPVPFSLGGKHYESIDGYEAQSDGSIRFSVDDPGWQHDTFCDAADLFVYRIENGKKVYSKNDAGGKRKITTVYWFE